MKLFAHLSFIALVFGILSPHLGRAEHPMAIEAQQLLEQNNPTSHATLFKLSQQSAEQGSALGYYLLGQCHAKGWGTAVNLRSAFQAYRQAARLGHPEAINSVGFAYLHGLGVKKDVEQAYTFFVEASLLGERHAMYNLGHLYENGIYVSTNSAQALYWYQQASAKGSPGAQEKIQQLKEEISPVVAPEASAPLTQTSPAPVTQEENTQTVESAVTKEPIEVSSPHPAQHSHILWILSGCILAVGLAWFLLHRRFVLRKAHSSTSSLNNGEMTFSCIDCGQQLLIPSFIYRRTLECPMCQATYEYWKDSAHEVHLENIHLSTGRKTRISFGTQNQPTLSPYEVLGLRRGCTLEELKEAFKSKIKEYHPDRVASLGEELRHVADFKTREINEAYQQLLQEKQEKQGKR